MKSAANSLKLRKSQRPNTTATVKPVPVEAGKVAANAAKTGLTGLAGLAVAGGSSPVVNESTGYDFIEGSGFVIEGKGAVYK